MMEKKYRLLKDLPAAKAGAIFTKGYNEKLLSTSEYRNGYYFGDDEVFYGYPVLSASEVEANPDWFEPIASEPEFTKLSVETYYQGETNRIQSGNISTVEEAEALKTLIEKALTAAACRHRQKNTMLTASEAISISDIYDEMAIAYEEYLKVREEASRGR